MQITSPYNTPDRGFSVGGTATLAVKVQNPKQTDRVEFYVDGKLLKTVYHYPFSCQWAGSKTTTGLHDFEAVSYLNSGEKQSIFQAFNVEDACNSAITNANAASAAIKGADNVFYRLDASKNSHSANHSEGLSLWKSNDQQSWSYAGLIWSFEGDGSEAEQNWSTVENKPSRSVTNAAIVFTNNNYYIEGTFEKGKQAKLLVSTTKVPEGPYETASTEEVAAYRISLTKNSTDKIGTIVSVYPNPSSQAFKVVSSEKFSYRITDLNQKTVESGVSSSTSLVGNSLKPGAYVLTVSYINGASKSVKIIKE